LTGTSVSVTVVGNQLTATSGVPVVTADARVALSGVSMAAQAGTVDAETGISVQVVGCSSTVLVGDVEVSIPGSVFLELTGFEILSTAGMLAAGPTPSGPLVGGHIWARYPYYGAPRGGYLDQGAPGDQARYAYDGVPGGGGYLYYGAPGDRQTTPVVGEGYGLDQYGLMPYATVGTSVEALAGGD
jgi:hypothetical protein